jgi:hypothetical protein
VFWTIAAVSFRAQLMSITSFIVGHLTGDSDFQEGIVEKSARASVAPVRLIALGASVSSVKFLSRRRIRPAEG